MISPYYTVVSSDNKFCKFNMGDLEFDSIARKSCIRPDYESAEAILTKVEKLHLESIAYYKKELNNTNNNKLRIEWLQNLLEENVNRTYQIIYVNFTEATGNE